MKSADLIGLAANKLGVSPYKIGKMLGYTDNRIYNFKSGKKTIPEKDAITICNWIDLDPAFVLASLKAERTTKPEMRKVWERVAALVEKATASAAALVLALGLAAPANNVHAAADAPPHAVYYVKLVLAYLKELFNSLYCETGPFFAELVE